MTGCKPASTSKEKLVTMEDGLVVDYKTRTPGFCLSFLHLLKIVLYLEVVLLLAFFFCAMVFYAIPVRGNYCPYETDSSAFLETENSSLILESPHQDLVEETAEVLADSPEDLHVESEVPSETLETSAFDNTDYNYLQLGPFAFRWHIGDEVASEESQESVREEEHLPEAESENQKVDLTSLLLSNLFSGVESVHEGVVSEDKSLPEEISETEDFGKEPDQKATKHSWEEKTSFEEAAEASSSEGQTDSMSAASKEETSETKEDVVDSPVGQPLGSLNKYPDYADYLTRADYVDNYEWQ